MGQQYKILSIKDPDLAARMISLGICPGKTLILQRQSPMGGAFYITIENCQFALRREEFAQLELLEIEIKTQHA